MIRRTENNNIITLSVQRNTYETNNGEFFTTKPFFFFFLSQPVFSSPYEVQASYRKFGKFRKNINKGKFKNIPHENNYFENS